MGSPRVGGLSGGHDGSEAGELRAWPRRGQARHRSRAAKPGGAPLVCGEPRPLGADLGQAARRVHALDAARRDRHDPRDRFQLRAGALAGRVVLPRDARTVRRRRPARRGLSEEGGHARSSLHARPRRAGALLHRAAPVCRGAHRADAGHRRARAQLSSRLGPSPQAARRAPSRRDPLPVTAGTTGTAGDRVDVLVIGAGAAVAWRLASAGIRVVCLEQGDWVEPGAYPHWRDDWELHRHTDWSAEPNVRRLAQDYPVNDEASPISPLMFNAVGGSTIHWSAHFPRFRPSDFRVKSLDGVADDWPVDYAALEPYFDLNDRMMGVAGMTGDPAYPPKPARQTPPIPLDTLGVTIARGFDRLGWHWWPSDSAILTRDYDGRRACVNCGPCDLGCPTGAKASTDVTYWPKALALGARLETRARVREITLGPNGLADGVLYYDRDGQLRERKAGAVVLAANGIGTPRLLLNSRSSRFPQGLGNRHGLVGRNLMFHPYAMVRGEFPEPLGGHRGPIGCAIVSQEFYETDRARGFVRGYSFQVARGLSPIASANGGLN